MQNIDEIVKQTLINLSKRSVKATPTQYQVEFCNVAKQKGYSTQECDKFKGLANIFSESLKPSISFEIDESLTKFAIKIGDSPSLMFEDEIQQEMQKFLSKRFEVDKKIVRQKTADIAKLVTLMGKYLHEAIDSSNNGGEEVSNIKGEIESFNPDSGSLQELSKLQNQLIKAASSIEDEMSNVSQKM